MKFFIPIILATIVSMGFGCQTDSINKIPSDQNLTETQQIFSSPSKSSTVLDFISTDYLPVSAYNIKVLDLDFDGGGLPEKVVTYKVDNVVYGQNGDTTNIEYLRVYKWGDELLWYLVKEDQRGEKNGPGQAGKFCQINPIKFKGTHRNYLLVRKCHLGSGDEGYYVFGEVEGKGFVDLEISKGYLNDETIELTSVTSTDFGLVEHYDVIESAAPKVGCWQLDVAQIFNPAESNFLANPDRQYLNCTAGERRADLDVNIDTAKVGDKFGEWTYNGGGSFSGEVQVTGSFVEDEPWPDFFCVGYWGGNLNDESVLKLPSESFCFTNQDEARAALTPYNGKEVTILIRDFVLDLRDGMMTINKAAFVSVVKN